MTRPRKTVLFLFAIFLSLALCAGAILALLALASPNWPIASRGQIDNSTLPLELQWAYRAEGNISSPPWYHEGMILVRAYKPASTSVWNFTRPNSVVEALDAETGRKRWRFARDAIGVIENIQLTLDAAGEIVVIGYLQGAMEALNVHTGDLLWERGPDNVVAIQSDERMLYMAGYGQVRAYDLVTGVWLWETDLQDEGNLGLALSDGRLYALRKKIWVLNPATGEIETVLEGLRASQVLLITHQKILAVGTDDERGRLVAYDQVTGEPLWVSAGKVDTRHPRVNVVGETVFFRTDTGSLMAMDVHTGKSWWVYRPSSTAEVISNAAVFDDLVYFLVSDKTLRAVDMHTGEEVGRLQSKVLRSWLNAELGEAIPMPGVAVSEDLFFVSFGGRTLYAFSSAE